MNIYETVTTRIMNQIQAGVLPWRKTWQNGLPKSLASGKEYRGLNLLILGASEYASRYWLTYRQAQQLGGQVREGEHAMIVVYWKWRTAQELEQRRQQTGRDNPAPCHPFTAAVFNLEQVDGIERPADDLPVSGERRLEIAERMMEIMPDVPPIVHTVTSSPSYCPALDLITLPHLSQFDNAEHYYAVLWHELVHSTGAPKRLHRFADAQRDQPEKYSFEELVAEFGSAFLCAFAGIQNQRTEELQASYIAGWASALGKDPRMLIRAASAAQRAVDYIRGRAPAADMPTAEAA